MAGRFAGRRGPAKTGKKSRLWIGPSTVAPAGSYGGHGQPSTICLTQTWAECPGWYVVGPLALSERSGARGSARAQFGVWGVAARQGKRALPSDRWRSGRSPLPVEPEKEKDKEGRERLDLHPSRWSGWGVGWPLVGRKLRLFCCSAERSHDDDRDDRPITCRRTRRRGASCGGGGLEGGRRGGVEGRSRGSWRRLGRRCGCRGSRWRPRGGRGRT